MEAHVCNPAFWCFFFGKRSLVLCPNWNAMAQSWLTATSTSCRNTVHYNLHLLGSRDPPPSASLSKWDYRRMPPHLANVFLVKIGFHHVAQADLKLLGSSNLLTLAFEVPQA